ncbi:MAG: TAXI family TRAP transporter solute-binding subunit [Betaproteobacteria bacterium]
MIKLKRGAAVAWGLVTAALLALFAWMLVQWAPPAVPRKLTMSTGPADGAYHADALRYRTFLARYGIELELRPSAGAAENLSRLLDPASGVDVAFVQSGLANEHNAPGVVSLGAMFYEPIWVFYRGAETVDRIAQLRGKRVAIGRPGSGTLVVGSAVARDNGLTAPQTTLVEVGGSEAAQALIDGRLDAVFAIGALESPAIQQLLRAPDVRVMNLRRADAYVRRLPYLRKVELPEGVIDLARDVPPQPVTLVATTADLVARQDIHPVLVDVLLAAARDVHDDPSLLAAAGTFPAPLDNLLPLSLDAERFYKERPGLLRRWLPFWAAVWVERLLFILLPLAAVAIPVVSYLPRVYEWRVRDKIHRWYGELYLIERNAGRGDGAARLARLAEIDALLQKLRVPKTYMHEVYTLREHVAYVRAVVQEQAVPGAP